MTGTMLSGHIYNYFINKDTAIHNEQLFKKDKDYKEIVLDFLIKSGLIESLRVTNAEVYEISRKLGLNIKEIEEGFYESLYKKICPYKFDLYQIFRSYNIQYTSYLNDIQSLVEFLEAERKEAEEDKKRIETSIEQLIRKMKLEYKENHDIIDIMAEYKDSLFFKLTDVKSFVKILEFFKKYFKEEIDEIERSRGKTVKKLAISHSLKEGIDDNIIASKGDYYKEAKRYLKKGYFAGVHFRLVYLVYPYLERDHPGIKSILEKEPLDILDLYSKANRQEYSSKLNHFILTLDIINEIKRNSKEEYLLNEFHERIVNALNMYESGKYIEFSLMAMTIIEAIMFALQLEICDVNKYPTDNKISLKNKFKNVYQKLRTDMRSVNNYGRITHFPNFTNSSLQDYYLHVVYDIYVKRNYLAHGNYLIEGELMINAQESLIDLLNVVHFIKGNDILKWHRINKLLTFKSITGTKDMFYRNLFMYITYPLIDENIDLIFNTNNEKYIKFYKLNDKNALIKNEIGEEDFWKYIEVNLANLFFSDRERVRLLPKVIESLERYVDFSSELKMKIDGIMNRCKVITIFDD